MIDLRSLRHALGGEINGGQLLCPGPGHSPRDRSLAVRPSSDGDFAVYSHAGDDWQTCKDYVRERLGWPAWQPGDGRDRRVPPSRVKAFDRAVINAERECREHTSEDRDRIKRAHAVWDSGVDPRGTLAEKYFAIRKPTLADGIANTVLRYHPHTPWRDENTGTTIYIPALIAAFISIDDGTITAIHRIRLDQPERWPKAERRMLGVVHRAAVKLDPASAVLHIGEGIETCLAARQLGYRPAWALGSVGAISHFPLIDGVAQLNILGAGTASADAIQLCGSRWHTAGRKVRAVMPDVGSDLNDELMAMAS